MVQTLETGQWKDGIERQRGRQRREERIGNIVRYISYRP